MPDTDNEIEEESLPHYMVTTGLICSSFSLVASGCMIVSYLMNRKQREHFYYFWVFHLAIADFLISAGGLYDWINANSFQCILFSAVLNMGLLCAYFFINYIAFVLYYSTSRTLETRLLYTQRVKIVACTYLLVLGLAIGPIFTDSYGSGGTYC